MRLINLGPGEITDRLTILALKILYAGQAEKPTEHFETERNALLVMLRGRTLNGAWFEQVLSLAAVNAALWRVEDEMRAFREEGQTTKNRDDIIECAFRIQELNDERAKLIETINKATGDHLGSEKLT